MAPVTSSLMIWLVLIVATAGANITSIITRTRGTLQTPSSDWSLCRHTVTPKKPGGSVTCQTISDMLVGEGGFDWMVDTPCSLICGFWTSPPGLWLWGLCFMPLDKGRVSPVATMGLEGCSTFSQPGNWFGGLLFAAGSMVAFFMRVLAGTELGSDLLGWDGRDLFWKSYALEHILSGEGEVAPHLFPKLHHAPHHKAWFTSSRQSNLLCPELKGPGICHHLLTLNFPDIPAGKDGIWGWPEILPAKTWQCRWSLMVILHLA